MKKLRIRKCIRTEKNGGIDHRSFYVSIKLEDAVAAIIAATVAEKKKKDNP